MTKIIVQVRRKIREADGVRSFELVNPGGAPLPAFTAGSHIDVVTPSGATRQYSLCNPSTERHRYVIGVLRDPASRGGSASLHDDLAEGDMLHIGLPRNHFPVTDGPPALLLAGGIGVTPILSMAEHLHAVGQPFEMHYCGRSASLMAFLDRLAASPFAASVRIHLDDGPSSQRLDLPAVLVGAVSGSHLYVCGPTGFMDWVIAEARQAGWPDTVIHREYFTGAVADETDDQPFEIEIASSGQVLTVPTGTRAIDVLAEAGFPVETSCEEGVCGTCVTRVLSGEVDHRDLFLTDGEKAANREFTPCVSRASCARLVLDL